MSITSKIKKAKKSSKKAQTELLKLTVSNAKSKKILKQVGEVQGLEKLKAKLAKKAKEQAKAEAKAKSKKKSSKKK